MRADQVGKRTVVVKVWQVRGGRGWVEGWRVGVGVVVVLGVKGLLIEGVRSALRCVEMGSSMVERERRRKSVDDRSGSDQIKCVGTMDGWVDGREGGEQVGKYLLMLAR